jgi:hypothetical protein
MNPINLADKLSTFSEYWQPRVVGRFNGHDLMAVQVKGRGCGDGRRPESYLDCADG